MHELEGGLKVRLDIGPITDVGAMSPMAQRLRNHPVIGDLVEMAAPKQNYVSWAFDGPREVINQARTQREKSRIGLLAMRRVMESLERDAARYSPKRYSFFGNSQSKRDLYASLSAHADRAGYKMQPDRYGAQMEMVRQYQPPWQDLAGDALVYGGAGAGASLAGLWAANANR